MIAFEQALAAQADGVETDVHLTRDGVIVICHDEDIRRTSNGIGAIAGQTLRGAAALGFRRVEGARAASASPPWTRWS